MTDQTSIQPATKRPRRMARQPDPATGAAPATKRPNKTTQILALLERAEGASLDQLVSATGWLPHTTRAALTGLKRKGHMLSSDKVDGLRIYRITTSVQAA